MHAALQSAFIQTDLVEHRSHGVDVHWLAAVRAAGDRDFLFREAKTIGSARSDHWNSLKRLSRRTYIAYGLRQAQGSNGFAPPVDRRQVSAMSGFDNRAAPDFDQRSWRSAYSITLVGHGRSILTAPLKKKKSGLGLSNPPVPESSVVDASCGVTFLVCRSVA